jgi:hypothetical protein
VRFELVSEALGLGLVEIVRQDGVGDVGRGDRPVLAAQVEEPFEGFGDSRGHADLGQRTPSVFEEERARGPAHLPSIDENALERGLIPPRLYVSASKT